MECKFCSSEKVVKHGIIRSKQRYYCKSCNRTFVKGDKRLKHTEDIKFRAVMLSLNNCGARVIGRALGINFRYISGWVNKYAQIVKAKLEADEKEEKIKVDVIQLDELWTYVKKKEIRSGYGLLWTKIGVKLLILK